ncbi:MAG: protein GlmU [Desulfosalsimonadaceae bacterium]
MAQPSKDQKKALQENGVRLPVPESVDIGPEVDPDRISGPDVTIYPGCRIYGADTCIAAGAKIGFEAPATVENCRIGPDVSLKGGFFSGAVFLNGASCGSCSHVRGGTILEEGACLAHSVGIKQTILFPHVTLGSLINFCDCLMAGGTDAKNHSEVGSSYIHFNYTPRQDKATASLIGDVPYGVMLDKPPVFLGGQGGLVGPCRLGYGVTVAAGTICRKDETRSNRLIFGSSGQGGNIAYKPAAYSNVKRILMNNLIYIGNLLALGQWYRHVRSRFISERYPGLLHEGLVTVLDKAVAERIRRLDDFIDNLGGKDKSALTAKKLEIREILGSYQGLEDICPREMRAERSRFLEGLQQDLQQEANQLSPYLGTIKSLAPSVKNCGSRWLQTVVDQVVQAVLDVVPEYGEKKGS